MYTKHVLISAFQYVNQTWKQSFESQNFTKLELINLNVTWYFDVEFI